MTDQRIPTTTIATATDDAKWFTMRPSICLSAAIVVALVLRVHCLIFPYLWLDEYVTLWSIGGDSYAEMLDRAMHWTASGPLFVLCYRLSCDLVGNVEWGIKLPGVIGGTVSVWAAWWLARRLFDRNDVGLVAAWFVALAPQFIHFSQEARPYMLGALLITLATGSLVGWIQTGRRADLFLVWLLSVAAVGLHLLAALAIVSQNVAVLICGIVQRWPRRRWIAWVVTQVATAVGLVFAGAQFFLLSARHSSMILSTGLPMPTRSGLDQELRAEFAGEFGFLLACAAVAWFCSRLAGPAIGKAWRRDRLSVSVIAVSYAVPIMLLTALCAARALDCWPRYYFLFQTGFLISLAWLVVRAFSPAVSRCAIALVVTGMLWHLNRVGGVLSCRLTGSWFSLPAAQAALRERIRPGDLVISRSGLIEANHPEFLHSPVGSNYLKCFCESSGGPLAGKHVPLPFSAESPAARRYVDELIQNQIWDRPDFWLVNIGPFDFDYRDVLRDKLEGRFEIVETVEYPFLLLAHYVRDEWTRVGDEKKGTSD